MRIDKAIIILNVRDSLFLYIKSQGYYPTCIRPKTHFNWILMTILNSPNRGNILIVFIL